MAMAAPATVTSRRRPNQSVPESSTTAVTLMPSSSTLMRRTSSAMSHTTPASARAPTAASRKAGALHAGIRAVEGTGRHSPSSLSGAPRASIRSAREARPGSEAMAPARGTREGAAPKSYSAHHRTATRSPPSRRTVATMAARASSTSAKVESRETTWARLRSPGSHEARNSARSATGTSTAPPSGRASSRDTPLTLARAVPPFETSSRGSTAILGRRSTRSPSRATARSVRASGPREASRSTSQVVCSSSSGVRGSIPAHRATPARWSLRSQSKAPSPRDSRDTSPRERHAPPSRERR